ncbi:MAG: hypothetical protein IKU10_00110, partial [Clostridia bacterium]|nr:hypothetical protein [Clostridia bacterium]
LLTPGDGKLLSAIHAVYGNEFASSLIPVSYEYNGIAINGYTCKPVFARKNRSMQLFFINGRFVKTGTGSAALQEAYKNAIMVGKFPAGVFHLQFPHHQIDVNVHPAKIEVRFSNERVIFDTVYYGVRSALEKGDTRPIMQLVKEEAPVVPQSKLKKASSAFQKPAPAKDSNATSVQKPIQTKFSMVAPTQKPITNMDQPVFNDVKPAAKASIVSPVKQPSFTSASSGASLDIAVEPAVQPKTSIKPKTETTRLPIITEDPPTLHMIGEVFKTYILVEVDQKILVIDKHAAHERILFDQLKETVQSGNAQLLLTPITLTLRKQEYSLLMENQDLLEQAGIVLESFGDSVVRVVGVPMNLENQDIIALMDEIATKLEKGIASVTADRLDWIYHSIACKAAVKGGHFTNNDQLMALAQRIVKDDSVRYCPHGRPVAMWLPKTQLEKLFGRSGS